MIAELMETVFTGISLAPLIMGFSSFHIASVLLLKERFKNQSKP